MEMKRIREVKSIIRDYFSYTIEYPDGVPEEELELAKMGKMDGKAYRKERL